MAEEKKMMPKKRIMQSLAVFVSLLFALLPVSYALSISNVGSSPADTSATITWQTDVESSHKVSYGLDKGALNLVQGNNTASTNAFVYLTGLANNTTYFYQVESSSSTETATENKQGEYFSFTTLESSSASLSPSTLGETSNDGSNAAVAGEIPPSAVLNISADVPLFSTENIIDLSGSTGVETKVKVFVNNQLSRIADTKSGQFFFTNIELKIGDNTLSIEAEDAAGSKASAVYSVFVDIIKPKLILEELPEFTTKPEITIKGTVSELSQVEITANGQSLFDNQTTSFSLPYTLTEGDNNLSIKATDKAGLSDEFSQSISMDSTPPAIQVTFATGNTYFQGRAEADIVGKTEPGAKVYLYTFQPQPMQYTPDFETDGASYETTADEEGNFRFDESDLEHKPVNLEKLAPKEVPAGLKQEALYPTETKDAAQQNIHVYFIAQDKAGLTAYTQQVVQIVNCYSSNLDFNIQQLIQFQLPRRLDPGAIKQGTQTISAVFNMSYRGAGVPKYDPGTGQVIEPAFKIDNVKFEKACIEGMDTDPSYNLSCRLVPKASPQAMPNAWKNAWYVRYTLQKDESLAKVGDDFWEEFKKRQFLVPLKLTLTYKERDAMGNLGPTKTQMSCQEIGYFVDLPIESSDMVPDFIADEGVTALNATVHAIDTVMPYIEKALLFTGIACMGSFVGKTAVKAMRNFASYLEAWSGIGKDEDKKCPSAKDQRKYPLNAAEKKIMAEGVEGTALTLPEKNLDELCPTTSFFWKFEAVMHKSYTVTCDRVFCRKSPSKWTESKDYNEVYAVKQTEAQCSGLGAKGVALKPIENCFKEYKLKLNPANFPGKIIPTDENGVCYLDPRDNRIYYIDTTLPENQEEGTDSADNIQELTSVGDLVGSLGNLPPEHLFAYKIPETEQFIVGSAYGCKILCEKTPGYTKKECAEEDKEGKVKVASEEFSQGYTKDCFEDGLKTGKINQCICAKKIAGIKIQTGQAKPNTEWFYHLDTAFRESGKKIGVYYPEWRYYTGRDFTAAFGMNSVLDWFTVGPAGTSGTGSVTTINPKNQYTGAFQTLCLSTIRGNLKMLRSILSGMVACIQEAKVNGVQNAGMCKELFTQYACGLIYKGISYLAKGCSPLAESDVTEDAGIAGAFKAGVAAIYDTMQTSASDFQNDYGNAATAQYFGTGAEGFSRSICLAAFGYDWLFDMDFLQDAAFEVPFKSSALVFPAERELQSYNPAQNKPVFNYRMAVNVFPGCRMITSSVDLKCIGPEDLGKTNVDCSGQGCDCIQALNPQAIGLDRTYPVYASSLIEAGSYTALPINSPFVVESGYRYDHVVVTLRPDPNQKMEDCFDEQNKDGIFYFPIKDVTSVPIGVCDIDPQSGKFYCAGLSDMFQSFGNAYFQSPCASCVNSTGQVLDCQSPNTFKVGDTIRIKPNIFTDGEPHCLRYQLFTGSSSQENNLDIPKFTLGTWRPEINLDEISVSQYGSGKTIYVTNKQGADCNIQVINQKLITEETATFTFEQASASGSYRLKAIGTKLALGAEGGYYLAPDGSLMGPNGAREFNLQQINTVPFEIGGFTVRNVLGGSVSAGGQCQYTTSANPNVYSSSSTGLSQMQWNIKMMILQPGPNGCMDAMNPTQTPQGASECTVGINIAPGEKAEQCLELENAKKLYKNGKYESAINLLIQAANTGKCDKFVNIFYIVASYVQWGNKGGDARKYKDKIFGWITLFNQEKASSTSGWTNDLLHQKIDRYLQEINMALGGTAAGSVSPSSVLPIAGGVTDAYASLVACSTTTSLSANQICAIGKYDADKQAFFKKLTGGGIWCADAACATSLVHKTININSEIYYTDSTGKGHTTQAGAGMP
ncbi:MAG TPA: hypothetical protein VJG31_03480 [Candidatus Nanoarchaeia archaeon]|nr:hypothetical protein [Candidatus Nanoarchaeia archaeon]